jgi:hypothetical protein
VAAGWVVGLAGVVWLGLGGRGGGTVVIADPGIAEGSSGPAIATAAAAVEANRGERLPMPAIASHRTFGEDGLMGGIVFGDNIPDLKQVDIERDGDRY